MHLSPPPPRWLRLLSVLRQWFCCCWLFLLLLPLWESVFVLCFDVRYFMSILVLQSSWWGRESWLPCLICLPGVSWWLSGLNSRYYGGVCSLWLWYFPDHTHLLFWTKTAAKLENDMGKNYRRSSVCKNLLVVEPKLIKFKLWEMW